MSEDKEGNGCECGKGTSSDTGRGSGGDGFSNATSDNYNFSGGYKESHCHNDQANRHEDKNCSSDGYSHHHDENSRPHLTEIIDSHYGYGFHNLNTNPTDYTSRFGNGYGTTYNGFRSGRWSTIMEDRHCHNDGGNRDDDCWDYTDVDMDSSYWNSSSRFQPTTKTRNPQTPKRNKKTTKCCVIL